MATDKTTKTRPRSKSKAKSKASTTPTKRSSTRASYSKKSFASLTDQLRSAFEREAATSNILRVIASSPSELQIVMDAIAENAARLCEADDVLVRQTDGVTYKTVSHFGSLPNSGDEIPVDIGSGPGRAILERRTVHVHDIQEAVPEFPGAKSYAIPQGIRTALAVPMLREERPIGVIHLRRLKVLPFTDRQICLLETFADQAVIAIENARLVQELTEKTANLEIANSQLTEALEQQTATSEILGVIAGSPTNIQPVLDAVAENAARLCDATDAVIHRFDGTTQWIVAHYGPVPLGVAVGEKVPTGREVVHGRAITERQTIHVHDIAAQIETEFPDSKELQERTGTRTILATPMLREDTPIGVIVIRRTEVRPFTDKQIALLKTFADQAVIAIENVRLFQELDQRNHDLTEALAQQIATSEILRIIASSPTDLQPMLAAIAESAAQLCQAADAAIHRFDGNTLWHAAHYGPIPVTKALGEQIVCSRRVVHGRAVLDRETIHIADIAAEIETAFPESKELQQTTGTRTILATPLLREGDPVGVIVIRRLEVCPFTEKQIALLKMFADQAVIAIENARLFQELKQALEQQTATSEILGVIAGSPADIQPIFNTIAENAARICGTSDVAIIRVEDDVYRIVATYGSAPTRTAGETRPIDRGSAVGRAVVDHQTIHIHDVREAEDDFWRIKSSTGAAQMGIRTLLAIPLLREGIAIGAISVRRTEVKPFTDKQIALLKTFADQAVIAIENVRLFKELQERNIELREALEHQTATSEVLGIISRSPTDVQPVLDAIVESAARVCGIDDVVLRLQEGNALVPRSHFGHIPISAPLEMGIDAPAVQWLREHGTLHIPDRAQSDIPLISPGSLRTFLFVPLRQQRELIGVLIARRSDVAPFTPAQIKLLETFADQAVIAIENVRLFKELQDRTRELAQSVGELRALGDVGQAVSSTLDLEKVLATIVSHAVQLSGCDCGVIYEYDESAQEFNLRATHRMEEEVVEGLRAARVRLGEGATGQAAITRAPVQIPDILEQRELTGTRARPLITRFGYRSLLSVPLLREQQTLGGLTVWRRQTGEFKPEVVNLLQTFATQSALAIHNARLFREIEDKSRQIEAANRHKSEFLANMSHELRTPLNAIIGFSEVLQEKLFGELNEKQAEYTSDILTSGQHLLSLINEILDLSKVEAGRMELEVAPFDLPLAIDNARTFVRERAVKHCITLDVDVDDRLGEYVGDERKIIQILLNLLSNAVKFTPEGGRISITANKTDNGAEISVSDTGIGIALEDQPKIFEEFRQVGSDSTHKTEGTGLGLTLAKKFVELHGGRIWVESAVGKGSTFIFILPDRPMSH